MKIGPNKNTKEKLYSKFYNSMRNLKNNGLVPTKSKPTFISKNEHNDNFWTERVFSNYSDVISLFYFIK